MILADLEAVDKDENSPCILQVTCFFLIIISDDYIL